MQDLHVHRRELTKKAQELHAKEKGLALESVLLIGELDRLRTDTALGLSTEQYIKLIGLTPNVYWKRLKAARIVRAFPQALALLKAGETSVSQVALLYPKLTPANAALVFRMIPNLSKREVEQFLSCLTPDGRLLDKEPEVEIRLVLTKSELALLDRAREVLAAAGHVPSNNEVVTKALGDLLIRRDPMQKAQRAAGRRERKARAQTQTVQDRSMPPSPGTVPQMPATSSRGDSAVLKENTWELPPPAAMPPSASPGTETPTPMATSAPAKRRPTIPASVRHSVMLRDQGQCTEILADGSRCHEKTMLEFNHRDLYCRGGHHAPANLDLKCRRHNQANAEKDLGPGWLVAWADSRRRAHPSRFENDGP